MIKRQKSFNPLECSLCKEMGCMYYDCYESMYNAGKRILVANCKRLQRTVKSKNNESIVAKHAQAYNRILLRKAVKK